MFITLLLPTILSACLVLLAAGIAVLLKVKNKLTQEKVFRKEIETLTSKITS